MSIVSSEILSLIYNPPIGGYLLIFPLQTFRNSHKLQNVFTVFVLNIDHSFVSINANVHDFWINLAFQ